MLNILNLLCTFQLYEPLLLKIFIKNINFILILNLKEYNLKHITF